ncbi:hypothetical protein BCAR13_440125 [Paraburkholderia caribensis]|nr:hypothetical protein BCAR13_440125 [Paraburkholderia caribensis]
MHRTFLRVVHCNENSPYVVAMALSAGRKRRNQSAVRRRLEPRPTRMHYLPFPWTTFVTAVADYAVKPRKTMLPYITAGSLPLNAMVV